MGRSSLARRAAPLLLAVALLGPSRTVEARGTLLMFEGSAGASTPAYRSGTAGWMAGLAFGPTLKLERSPLRFHILGNVQLRRSEFPGALGDARSRADVLYFLSQRTVLPVVYPLRFYLETGVGARQTIVELPSGRGLTEVEPLIAFALGAQLRWTREWSLGLRAGWEPALDSSSALDLGRDRNPDVTVSLTLGAHF